MMTQSSRTRRPLPAWPFVLLSVVLWTSSLAAQTRYRVIRSEPFRQESGPQARDLATVSEGVEVTGGSPRAGWVAVVLEGWVWGASVGRTARDGHNLAISSGRGENLRVAPNGDVIARLLTGFLLDEVSRDGPWVRAKRSGWMPAAALAIVTDDPPPAVATAPKAALDTSPAASGRPSLDRAVTTRETPFARTAESEPSGSLGPDTPVRLLARNGEWVRVQVEGWVRESDVRIGGSGVLLGVTAAELRTRPQDFENKLVQWTLQYLSLMTADELRPEIPLGRRYLLTRGPLPEASFVYVSLDAQQLKDAERLSPLAQIVVVARIKVAKTKHLGNPVVELVEMQVKTP